jgi:hypothetical protein
MSLRARSGHNVITLNSLTLFSHRKMIQSQASAVSTSRFIELLSQLDTVHGVESMRTFLI